MSCKYLHKILTFASHLGKSKIFNVWPFQKKFGNPWTTTVIFKLFSVTEFFFLNPILNPFA